MGKNAGYPLSAPWKLKPLKKEPPWPMTPCSPYFSILGVFEKKIRAQYLENWPSYGISKKFGIIHIFTTAAWSAVVVIMSRSLSLSVCVCGTYPVPIIPIPMFLFIKSSMLSFFFVFYKSRFSKFYIDLTLSYTNYIRSSV